MRQQGFWLDWRGWFKVCAVISEGRCLKISYMWIGQYTYIMLKSKGYSWKNFLSSLFTENDMLSLIHNKIEIALAQIYVTNKEESYFQLIISFIICFKLFVFSFHDTHWTLHVNLFKKLPIVYFDNFQITLLKFELVISATSIHQICSITLSRRWYSSVSSTIAF